MNHPARTRLTVSEHPGTPDVLWLDNSLLRIGILPAAGGRILSVEFQGQELLWRNADLVDENLHPVPGHFLEAHDGTMADWNNYGGDKTWPAPQGWSGPDEWAGPPDPVLDSGVYTWSSREIEDGGRIVELTSGEDPRTGLRLTRILTLRDGEAAYDLTLRAENISERNVTWALWNVTQRRADEPGTGGVCVGVDDRELELVELVPGTGVPAAARHADAAFIPHQDVVGKLGFPTATGWLAHAAQGSTTTQTFGIRPDQPYPDGGSRVEVWMEYPLEAPIEHLGGLHPKFRIIEIEVLGPSVGLKPGQRTEVCLRSGSSSGTTPVSAVAEAGHWGPVEAGTESEVRQVDFFPYVSGTLELRDTGEEIARVSAGSPSPVRISPELAGRAVRVRSAAGTAGWDAGTLSPATEERKEIS